MKKLIFYFVFTLLPFLAISQYAYYSGMTNGDGINFNTANDYSYNDSAYTHYPAVIDANDVGLIHVAWKTNTTIKTHMDNGWTLITSDVVGGLSYGVALYWKRFDGTEDGDSSLLIMNTNTCHTYSLLTIWKNCATTGTPYENAAFYGIENSGTYTVPSITTTGNNRTVLTFTAINNDGRQMYPIRSYSKDTVDANQLYSQETGGSDNCLNIYQRRIASASTLSEQWVANYGNTHSNIILALKPVGTALYDIQQVSHSVVADSGGVNNIDVTFPATVTEGQFFLLCAMTESAAYNINTPSGWTSLGKIEYNAEGALFWYRADGTEGGTTVNITCSSSPVCFLGVMYGYDGVLETGTPIESVQLDGIQYGSTFDARAVTSTKDKSLAVCICFHEVTKWRSAPVNYQAIANATAFSGDDLNVTLYHQELPTTTTTTLTVGKSMSNGSLGSFTLVLNPEPKSTSCDYPGKIDGMSVGSINGMTIDCDSKVDGM